MLAALGLWAGVAPGAADRGRSGSATDAPGEGASRLFLHFDGQEIDEGPMGAVLEDRFLRAALLAAIEAEPAVEHRAGAEVVGQEVGPAASR